MVFDLSAHWTKCLNAMNLKSTDCCSRFAQPLPEFMSLREAETGRLAKENRWILRREALTAGEGFLRIPPSGGILYPYEPGANELAGLSLTTECCISKGDFN
jgi:hypothetical protein